MADGLDEIFGSSGALSSGGAVAEDADFDAFLSSLNTDGLDSAPAPTAAPAAPGALAPSGAQIEPPPSAAGSLVPVPLQQPLQSMIPAAQGEEKGDGEFSDFSCGTAEASPAVPTAQGPQREASAPLPSKQPPTSEEAHSLLPFFFQNRALESREEAYPRLLRGYRSGAGVGPASLGGRAPCEGERKDAELLCTVVPGLPLSCAQDALSVVVLGGGASSSAASTAYRPSAADLLAPLLAAASLAFPSGEAPSAEACARAASTCVALQAAILDASPQGLLLQPAQLYAMCLYHDPELTLALDKACPSWWKPAGLEGEGVGCIPSWWCTSLFSGALRGASLPADAILPLWDRFVVFLFALQPSLTALAESACPRTGFACTALAAALIFREATSLKAIARTAAAASSSSDQAAPSSAKGSMAGARVMITSTLSGALKRALWKSRQQAPGTDGQPQLHPFSEAINSLLASAAALASATPQSVLGFSPPPNPSGSSSPSQHLSLRPWEALPQALLGWSRVARAGESCSSALASLTQPSSPSQWLLPSPVSPVRPLHHLFLDIRPFSHRRCGRLSGAIHINPSSLGLSEEAGKGAWVAAAEVWEESSWGSEVRVGEAAALPSSAADAASDVEHAGSKLATADDKCAGGCMGLPLDEALSMLRPSNTSVHFVVVGVGVSLLAEAYRAKCAGASAANVGSSCASSASMLEHCAALDDLRVATLARVLSSAGFKYVSTLAGGFASLLQCPLHVAQCPLPAASPGGAENAPPCPPSMTLGLLGLLHSNSTAPASEREAYERARFALGGIEASWMADGVEGGGTSSSSTEAADDLGGVAAELPGATLAPNHTLPPHLFAISCFQDYSAHRSPYVNCPQSVGTGRQSPVSHLDSAAAKLKEWQAAAAPALSAFKSGAVKMWDDFAQKTLSAPEAPAASGGGGGGGGGVEARVMIFRASPARQASAPSLALPEKRLQQQHHPS